MTVNTITNIVNAVGNGVSTSFAINFQFYIKQDLVVTLDNVVQSPGTYNVTGGAGSTGTLIFLTPPANGVNVTISRILALVQQASFQRNDPFPAKTHEIALDRIVMMMQQLASGSGGGGGDVSPEFIQDTVAAMFGGPQSGLTVSYDDPNGLLTFTVTTPGLPDAPADSIYYVRRNNTWVQMDWANIANKPATFTPSTHTHTSTDITDFAEASQDTIAPMFTHSLHTNISFTYDDANNRIIAIAQQANVSTGIGSYTWDDSSTTMADPGVGKIRGNNALMASITHLAINKTDTGGLLPDIFAMGVNDIIIISNTTSASPGKYTISAITNNTAWVDFTVVADTSYSTGNPGNGDVLKVSGVRAGAGSGIGDAPNDGTFYGRGNLGWSHYPWTDLTGKPSTFPPSPHTHVVADITDFPANNVVGPGSATDGHIAVYNGATGKIIKDSLVSINSAGKILAVASAAGTASINLAPGSAPTTPADGDQWVTTADFFVRINGTSVTFARTVHTHAESDVTNLVTDLANREIVGEYNAINAQTGTTYTFVSADKGKLVTASNASAQTYTVPPNSSQPINVKGKIDIIAIGAGQVTLAAGAGVTLNSPGGLLKLRVQNSAATLVKIATDTWQVFGDLA